jgi:hypothetical protein
MPFDQDHPSWEVTVDTVDDTSHTFSGIHRVRVDGHWVILERYDGPYGDDMSLRAWSFYGPGVRKISQL